MTCSHSQLNVGVLPDGSPCNVRCEDCGKNWTCLDADTLVSHVERKAPAQEPAVAACRCGKWRALMGSYDLDGYTLRCAGCLRAVAKCRCL